MICTIYTFLPTTEPQPISGNITHNITSLNTSIAINWTHTPVECYKNRTSYKVSWVNIDTNTKNGSDNTSATEYNITGLVVNGNYTVSVWAVVDGNIPSTAVSKNVTTGELNVEPSWIQW